MKIEEKNVGGVVVLSVKGSIMNEPESRQFRKVVYELLETKHRNFVVDIAHVDRMSSIGLGAVMAAAISVRTRGGDLSIANASTKTGPLFIVTKLVKVLKLYESVEKALAGFK